MTRSLPPPSAAARIIHQIRSIVWICRRWAPIPLGRISLSKWIGSKELDICTSRSMKPSVQLELHSLPEGYLYTLTKATMIRVRHISSPIMRTRGEIAVEMSFRKRPFGAPRFYRLRLRSRTPASSTCRMQC